MDDQNRVSTSRDLLTDAAYANDHDLRARQSLYHFQRPTYDLVKIVSDSLRDIRGVVADVGCGNGKNLNGLRARRPDLKVIGVDLSPGIMAGLEPPLVVADAMRLPFAESCLDGVLAMHMLYHVDDVTAGLAELARVLRPTGTCLVSTNAADDKAELDQLWADAAGDVLGLANGPRRVSLSSRFTLDVAPTLLAQHFSNVTVIELPGVISVDDPEPVLAHLASYRAWSEEMGVPFQATLQRVRERLKAHIDREGKFEITCEGGVLVCGGPVHRR